MIQINLLPDVKVEYIKAKRTKRLVIVSSLVVSAVSLAVLFIVGSIVYGAQKIQLNNLDTAIKTNSNKLLATPDLDKVLTIQNQLNSLDKLHSDDPLTSRLPVFLKQLTPNDVQISSVKMKYEDTTLIISGDAKNLESVNKYVDTLKFTKYTTDSAPETEVSAFSVIVLDSFKRTDKESKYTIMFKFDPILFSRANKTITLIVPKITSTRSETERPTSLFKEEAKTTENN